MSIDPVMAAALNEAGRMVRAVRAAEEIQWERSPVPTPRTDTTQRASGGHGDPTADIVLDPRRTAVRDAVQAAEKVVRDFALALQKARHDVDKAVEAWNGE